MGYVPGLHHKTDPPVALADEITRNAGVFARDVPRQNDQWKLYCINGVVKCMNVA